MLLVDPNHLVIVKNILAKYPHKFCVFGSRTKGNPKRYSDLDICIMDEIKDLELSYIEDEFENSDLPFKVDLIVWNNISDEFKDIIRNDLSDLIINK